MGLSKDELLERCRQLDIDCDVAISAAEGYKKELDDMASKTWQNIVTILSKNLKKGQTPEQAYDELKATSQLSKEVLQNIRTVSGEFETLEKIETWFSNIIGLGVGGVSSVASLGIGAYVKYVAEPRVNAAAAATIRALDALEGRAGNAGARVLGPNVAAQTAAERELLTRNVLAAAREEALLLQRVANLRKWTGRLNKLGLFSFIAVIGVGFAVDSYEESKQKHMTNDIKHSLHLLYTSRFYMTVQQKYLEFLMHHVSQLEIYSALLAQGNESAAATVLTSITSHAIELDPKTNEVKPESIRPQPWTEEAVTAELAKRDKDKLQKTADDPTKEQREKYHEEQLRKIGERLKELEKAHAADAGAAKPN